MNGKPFSMILSEDEFIIGVKGNMCAKYLRGIGFYIWKVGMGVNIEGEEFK